MRITWSIKLGVLTGLLFCYLNSFAQSSLLDSLINRQQIQQTVEYLASDSLQGRFTGTKAALTAANFIADQFRRAGLQTLDSTNGYLNSFTIAAPEKIIGYNVVGVLPGSEKPDESILFSAHYDHLGTLTTHPYQSYSKRFRKNSTDSIFNGANDNASGTSALISLARYFGFNKTNKRTIIFVAFAGEELGLFGSTALANSLTNPASVTCMINLEMLGRGHSPFITGSELGDLRRILNKELAKTGNNLYPAKYFGREHNPEQKLFMRSDNYPFAKLGIPAHTIMAGSDLDDYYHTVDDEPSTLNYELIRTIAIAAAIAVRPIVNGEVKLQRIDPADYKALFQGN